MKNSVLSRQHFNTRRRKVITSHQDQVNLINEKNRYQHKPSSKNMPAI